MAKIDDSDINDIFKDYEYKVTGKKAAPEIRREPVRQLEEENEVKEKYRKAESKLREKKPKETGRNDKAPLGNIVNRERLIYIGIIIVLVAYIGFGFFQGNDDIEEEQTLTAAAVNMQSANKTINKSTESSENASEETQEESTGNETAEETVEDDKLSGKIVLTLDKVDAEVVDVDGDLGQISKVKFTIENSKDKDLNPIVDVYAYDSKIDPNWEVTSRGQYKGSAIKAGDKYSGSISLVPKTFRKLNITKSIRLSLNDTEDGFITAVNKEISIS
ncbi:hypothetical protein HYW19_03120 [Candidatus Woesearchaeota archaeon]|nr:hypothetical protein [Candidatus Woesearchaeota archaeon]